MNEELHGVTSEEPVYQIPNNEVDQLRQHTHSYLQSISQIPIVYQIPRSHTSHRRTQLYGENETLYSSLYDLTIYTIFEINQPIAAISPFETKEYPQLQNLLDFPEVDSTFYDFPKAEAGSFGPPEPPETNPPCTNPLSPQPNFNFLDNMEANRPWLVVDAIVVPSAQHPLPIHLENLLPKFDPDNDVTPEDHIKQFMLSLILMDVQHEYVVFILFPYTFIGQSSKWSYSLAVGSIASWQ